MATGRRASRSSWGKIRKLPSGRFQASYVGPDGTRYPGPMTYSSKVDAQTWLAQVRTDIASGKWMPHHELVAAEAERSITLGAYSSEWLKTRTNARGEHLRPRTRAEYERLLRGPLHALSALPLRALTPRLIRDWRDAELRTGRKTQTARAYGLLNAILATATVDRILDSNPCVIPGGQSTSTRRKVVPPTDAELETILRSITPRFRALVVLAASGGLRYGEAIELRAKDVTVEREPSGGTATVRVRVERAVTHVPGMGFVVGPPKSEAGVRTVAIFGPDASCIAKHLQGLIGDALLFPSSDGKTHLSQSTFIRHWYAARQAAGREDMPFHALRHYAGTRYAQVGATPRETMARLGHSSLGAAMRYQHSGDRDDELAARMAQRRA